MKKMNHDEAVQLLQDGKITYREFVEAGPRAEEFRQWCRDHGVEPNEDNAEFFCDMNDIEMMDGQDSENE